PRRPPCLRPPCRASRGKFVWRRATPSVGRWRVRRGHRDSVPPPCQTRRGKPRSCVRAPASSRGHPGTPLTYLYPHPPPPPLPTSPLAYFDRGVAHKVSFQECTLWAARLRQSRRSPMKNLVLIVALGLAVAFTTSVFAGDTEADCQKAGGTWDAKTKTCSNKY